MESKSFYHLSLQVEYDLIVVTKIGGSKCYNVFHGETTE